MPSKTPSPKVALSYECEFAVGSVFWDQKNAQIVLENCMDSQGEIQITYIARDEQQQFMSDQEVADARWEASLTDVKKWDGDARAGIQNKQRRCRRSSRRSRSRRGSSSR